MCDGCGVVPLDFFRWLAGREKRGYLPNLSHHQLKISCHPLAPEMFSKVVILLALVAIAFVHGLDEKLILQLKNKHNAIKNAKASGKKIQVSAVRDQSVATSYVVVSTYPDGSLCEGTPDLTMGLAVDTCIIGEVDYTTGTPQSSIKYYKDALGQVFMSYYSEAADCTGTFSDTQVNVPTPCINGNMKVTYQESSEPWTGNNADGVVIEFFDTGDHCGEGGSGYDFIWYANNYCIPDAAEDGSYQSYQYSDCADGYILVHYYTDAKCTNALTTTPVSLSSCMETTNNLQPAWITQACSFVDNSASGNSAV